MKTCSCCNIEKDDSDFYSHGGYRCKKCVSELSKIKYHNEREKYLTRHAEYRKRNKDKIRKAAAIYRKKINHSDYSNRKAKEYRRGMTSAYIKARIRGLLGIKNDEITDDLFNEYAVKILIERIKKQIEFAGSKICDRCKKIKTLDDYYPKKFWWKGEEKYQLDNYCKSCRNNYTKKIRKNERHSKPEKSLV